MGHIGLLGLYKLGQKYLEVHLKDKNMAQYSHCAQSKITQQILCFFLPNKATRPFYCVFIDWLDLDKKWGGYQRNGTIVRQTMIIVCEATGIAMTYFTQSAKKNENLPLVKNFMNWLARRHNLDVKVIWTNNEMNRLKTRTWCDTTEISLELCTPDTHAQNSGVERFGRLIIECEDTNLNWLNVASRLTVVSTGRILTHEEGKKTKRRRNSQI